MYRISLSLSALHIYNTHSIKAISYKLRFSHSFHFHHPFIALFPSYCLLQKHTATRLSIVVASIIILLFMSCIFYFVTRNAKGKRKKSLVLPSILFLSNTSNIFTGSLVSCVISHPRRYNFLTTLFELNSALTFS